jgi:thiaminase
MTRLCISALEKKEIPRNKLELFVFEQYHIIKNDRRNYALMVSKASSDLVTKLFLDFLYAEDEALDNLFIMARERIAPCNDYFPLYSLSRETE